MFAICVDNTLIFNEIFSDSWNSWIIRSELEIDVDSKTAYKLTMTRLTFPTHKWQGVTSKDDMYLVVNLLSSYMSLVVSLLWHKD